MIHRIEVLILLTAVCLAHLQVSGAEPLGKISVDQTVIFENLDNGPVTLSAGDYDIEDTAENTVTLVATDGGQRTSISAERILRDPIESDDGVQFLVSSEDTYRLVVPVSETEALFAEATVPAVTTRATRQSVATLATPRISALDAPDGSPRQAIRVDNNGKVIVGSASVPSRYNFDAMNFEVRGAGNYTSTSGPRFVARFSNAGGSGSGVIIQTGYKHSRAKPIEILRLAPFDGPAEFIFFNDGRSSGLSDERLKTDIRTLDGTLARLEDLRGVTFRWHDTEDRQIGLIAQDVERAFPELVTEVDGYKGVDYARFPAVLLEAIKEMKAELDVLKSENQVLRECIGWLYMKKPVADSAMTCLGP